MSSGTIVIVVVVVIVVIVALAALAMSARRRRLREQFGPEYDRVVAEQSSKLRAEAELSDRQRRVRKLDIKPLSEDARARYLADWMVIQEQFVDAPQAAVADAYALVTTVMKDRGYPTDDDEQVMADLSVEHAETVGHFRAARVVAMNAAAGDIATEDLRQALIHYRALFSDLLGTAVTAGSAVPADGTVAPDGTVPADGTVSDAALPADAAALSDSTVPAGSVADTDPDGIATGVAVEDRADAPQRY